jgi:DNA-binding PadR family transcriptional regulator
MARELLGEVEHVVLLALLRLAGPQYGVPILDEIESRTGRKPSRAAVYIALQRLETKGLVRSRLGEPTAERGGRARRYFQLERAGLTALRDSRQALVSMWADIEHRLDTGRPPRTR